MLAYGDGVRERPTTMASTGAQRGQAKGGRGEAAAVRASEGSSDGRVTHLRSW
jgi:hypothetical protein